MIYTNGRYIASDGGLAELHEMANRLGLSRFYFEDKKYYLPVGFVTVKLYARGVRYLVKSNWKKLESKIRDQK